MPQLYHAPGQQDKPRTTKPEKQRLASREKLCYNVQDIENAEFDSRAEPAWLRPTYHRIP
jgi:hypothetical protein